MPRSETGDQLSLFPDNEQTTLPISVLGDRIVNVASVPQRSPFRYPGGKTWLIPKIRAWLKSSLRRYSVFVEPFCGGGIVSLTVAFEQLSERVVMVELDEDVASVWTTILSGDWEWLRDRILHFDLTPESAREELSRPSPALRERAFATLLRNRINHGGILAPGGGMIKNGENGRGIRSRWYPETLAKRIEDIRLVRDRIEFVQGDGLEVMKRHLDDESAAFFVDPPYTAAGKKAGTRLYAHNVLDHERLFACASEAQGEVLMTYDLAEPIVDMASRNGFEHRPIAMKNTHHAEMNELLIGKRLDWLED